MAIRPIDLTDEWAPRNLTICVRRAAELPVYARRLVEHLASASELPGGVAGISVQI
jgi:hypothetical protein